MTERRLRLIAPPAMLAFAWLCVQADGLRALARIFASMWLHEAGHAITAWLSGIAAFPGPWLTPMGESRSWMVSIFVIAALGLLVWRVRHWVAYGAAGILFVVELALTLGVPIDHAQVAILFFGDGGAMVLGTILVLSFWSPLGSLRWGLLFIGAFALMDPLTLWMRARHDLDVIPFGGNEGAGASDPSRLVDEHNWGVKALVARYVTLGVICLLALAGRWVVELLRPPASPEA